MMKIQDIMAQTGLSAGLGMLFFLATPTVSLAAFDIAIKGFFTAAVALVDNRLPNQEATSFLQNAEIHFRGETEIGVGNKIGFQIELEGQETGDQIDEHYVYASGIWGKVILGAENGVGHLGEVTAPAFITGLKSYNNSLTDAVIEDALPGIDDEHMSTKLEHISGDAPKITYFSPRLAGVQIGVSFAPNNSNLNGGESNFNAGRADQKNIFEYSLNYQYRFGGDDGVFRVGYTLVKGLNTANFGEGFVANNLPINYAALTLEEQAAEMSRLSGILSDPQSRGLGFNVKFRGFHIGLNETQYRNFGGYAGNNITTLNSGFAYDINENYRIGLSYTNGKEENARAGRHNLSYTEYLLGGTIKLAKGVGLGYYYQEAKVDYADDAMQDRSTRLLGALVTLKF